MNGNASAATFTSDVSMQTTTPVINSEQILSAYRKMEDKNREVLRDQMQQTENELLIERYNALDNDNRRVFFIELDSLKKNVILRHYLTALDNSVFNLELQRHPASDIANKMATQLRSIHKASEKSSNIKSEEILDIVHKTTDLIQTPPFNQDMTPNPAFEQRSNALTDSSNTLRKSGKWQVFFGLVDVFSTLVWIAASVLLGLHLGGIIGHASTLVHAIAPLSFAVNTYFTLNKIGSSIGHFSDSHRLFSVTNKANAFVQAMQPAPVAATQTEDKKTTKLSK